MTDSTLQRSACERVQGRLERLMDGGLAALEEARDQGHLEACGACSHEREAWEGFMGLMRQAEAPSGALAGEFSLVQRQLAAQLEQRIGSEVRARRTARRLSIGAAAAALLLVGGFFVLAESTPGLLRAEEISQLEFRLPPWGDFLSQIGSLGSAK